MNIHLFNRQNCPTRKEHLIRKGPRRVLDVGPVGPGPNKPVRGSVADIVDYLLDLPIHHTQRETSAPELSQQSNAVDYCDEVDIAGVLTSLARPPTSV